ncbi:MAG: sigma-54 dependent transcriptional regulator [Deltaproteobacteria bacterium]|jgi:two-component system response regulator AtoC
MPKRPDCRPTNFHGLLTCAPEMEAFFALLQRVARSQASVLVRGETGTGKELVARTIHTLSRRSGGPFLAVNCATFTPELLASELFGHVRGAFTGAVQNRQGLFALADGGTLFLDEVAEMPLDLQARLLRVLEEKAFVPVGGSERHDVDVRILAATHKSLRREVHGGRFREDLMFRIRVVPLFVPRLTDRTGDIEALMWHFVEELNDREDRQVDTVSPAAMTALLGHEWPGNVRELRNVIEYAFIVGDGRTIELEDLTPELRGEAPPGAEDEDALDLKEIERRSILEALNKTGGRKAEAAELLQMSRTTLWRKLKEHRLIE